MALGLGLERFLRSSSYSAVIFSICLACSSGAPTGVPRRASFSALYAVKATTYAQNCLNTT